MKKVILSISAMLFVSAAAFAQANTANAYQKGNVQIGFITQFGSSNDGIIQQGVMPTENAASHHNTATISQNGFDNYARTSQNNQENMAYQSQTGMLNTATIWQDEHLGGALLWGSDQASQVVNGDNNSSVIDQGTSGNNPLPANPPFNASEVLLAAGVAVPALPHYDNTAGQVQNNDWGVAYASQGGKQNMSSQTQDGTWQASSTKKNVSNHYQYGDYNSATSNQSGGGLVANTLQVGTSNTATVTQWDMDHSSVIVQSGSNNICHVLQDN